MFINQHDEVNILVAMTYSTGDDLKCVSSCHIEFFTIELVGDSDVKVIDRFVTPVKINLINFYPIEYTEVVYIVSHTSSTA